MLLIYQGIELLGDGDLFVRENFSSSLKLGTPVSKVQSVHTAHFPAHQIMDHVLYPPIV